MAMNPAVLTIIVFARAPVPGRCKTRLIPAYGARGAVRIHRQLVRKTLATACALPRTKVELWCEPDTGHSFFRQLRRDFGVALRRQPAGDLGRKMALALARTLTAGARKVLLIGTDCAALTPADLETAAAALQHGDVVLQPAEDGGYVLIGARRTSPSMLQDVAWSSGRELRQTLSRLQRRQLHYRLLPTRWDVDHPREVRRAKREGLLAPIHIRKEP
jgi:hypothetical protein